MKVLVMLWILIALAVGYQFGLRVGLDAIEKQRAELEYIAEYLGDHSEYAEEAK